MNAYIYKRWDCGTIRIEYSYGTWIHFFCFVLYSFFFVAWSNLLNCSKYRGAVKIKCGFSNADLSAIWWFIACHKVARNQCMYALC